MSSDIFHELNPVLVAQVDAFAEVLEQRNLARDAAVCLEQELTAAEAEIAELRAGEAEDYAEPYMVPTPAQWLKHLHRATAERRIEMVTAMFANADRGNRCFQMDHDSQIEQLRGTLPESRS